MELFVWQGGVSADVVQARDTSFASQFVDQFGLPEQHHVLLVLDCFLHFGCEEFACLFLFDFEDFTKGP